MEAKAFVTSAVVLLLIVADVLQATNDSACSDGSLMSLGVHRSALSVRHPILWSCFKRFLKPPSCFCMAWNVFDYHVLLGTWNVFNYCVFTISAKRFEHNAFYLRFVGYRWT